MVTQFITLGNSEQILESIAKFVEAGATQIVLRDVLGLSVFRSLNKAEERLKIFEHKIIPYFNGDRSSRE